MEYKMKDIEFSNKTCKKSVYKTALDDFEDLYEIMSSDKFIFQKLEDMVYLESCGKNKYCFYWNTLNVTVEQQKNTYKIKTIEVYDLKTQDFLCYMKLKK